MKNILIVKEVYWSDCTGTSVNVFYADTKKQANDVCNKQIEDFIYNVLGYEKMSEFKKDVKDGYAYSSGDYQRGKCVGDDKHSVEYTITNAIPLDEIEGF